LKAAGVGCTEVLPLERVLDAEQARQAGTLRNVRYRDLAFDVPEFPRLHANDDGVQTLPPPDLGEHTLDVLQAAGLSPDECEALMESGAVSAIRSGDFAWAPVRRQA
jgi:crotonobetainyl-CoA:carnitine CoA-transferase CaiB-like acyl-CoA transferase